MSPRTGGKQGGMELSGGQPCSGGGDRGLSPDIRTSLAGSAGKSLSRVAPGQPRPPRIPEPRPRRREGPGSRRDGMQGRTGQRRDKDGTESGAMGPRRDETGMGPQWDQDETGQGWDRREAGRGSWRHGTVKAPDRRTGEGQNRDGTGMGQERNRNGTRIGQVRDRNGTGPGQRWWRTGPAPSAPAALIGQSRGRRSQWGDAASRPFMRPRFRARLGSAEFVCVRVCSAGLSSVRFGSARFALLGFAQPGLSRLSSAQAGPARLSPAQQLGAA